MARLPRLTVADQPHHILLAGNNRQAVFEDSADRQHFLELLTHEAAQARVVLHAWVLLDCQLQILASPEDDKGIPRLMQGVGRRYVRAFNTRHARTGTLWEGRYKSTLIQAEKHLLDAMVYMDTAPVRAGLVEQSRGYVWSTHDHYVGLRQERAVTAHPVLWTLANTPFAREIAYAERVAVGLTPLVESQLAQAARSDWALGDADYLAQLQRATDRRVSRAKVGRPRLKQHPPAP